MVCPADQPVGLIVMDFAARRRLRINGTLSTTARRRLGDRRRAGIRQLPPVHSAAAGARRGPTGTVPQLLRRGDALEPDDIQQVQSADTFFLGTTPCRVRQRRLPPRRSSRLRACRRATVLRWPDFPGNNMFNSLGNLAVDPAAALLFVDFVSGRTLQLSGTAEVQWDGADERSVEFDVRDVAVTRLPTL